MNEDATRVNAALRHVDLWPRGAAQPEACLGRGPTRESWLVRHDGERFVVRVCTPDAARLGLQCSGEAALTRAAEAAGLGPPCVAAYPEHGVLVTRYIEGRVWTGEDLRQPAQRERLAGLLRRLHAVQIDTRSVELARTLRLYAQQVATDEARTIAGDGAGRLFRVRARRVALCHGDPVAANVIDDGTLRLVDWEYAGLGNPFFDLAVVVRWHGLGDAEAQAFLNAYDAASDEADWQDLLGWCAIFDRVWLLWLLALGSTGTLDGNQQAQLASLRARM